MFSNHNDPGQTIGTSGCGATSFAMLLAVFIDPGISPPIVAGVILNNGYRTDNDGVDWSFYQFASQYYGLRYENTVSTDEVIEALKKGALVVASMGPGYFTRIGHYVLLWGLNEASQEILVNDPNSETRVAASYNTFREQACNYFIFYPKEGTDVSGRFADVPDNHFGKQAVEQLANMGIVNGRSEGVFDPNAPISRIENAFMLYNALVKLGVINPNQV